MTKIEQIETISNKISQSTIKCLPKRCVYMRNWNSKCRACLNACSHDAIKRELSVLYIQDEKCSDCGACVSSCPTSSFLTSAPDAESIVKSALASAAACGGNALFMCASDAKKVSIDISRVVILPCLNYLDEYLLIGLFAHGAKAATLMYCGCDECEIDSETPYFKSMIKNTKNLLKHWNIDAKVRLTHTIPDALIIKKSKHVGSVAHVARRDAFANAGNDALGFLVQSFGDTLGKYAGQEVVDKKKQRVVVRMTDRFELGTYRARRVLHMLDKIGEHPTNTNIESRFWANLAIDEARCRYCGLCAQNCITQALHFEQDETSKEGTLTFEPVKCVGCRLCHDACLSHAMIYSNVVNSDDLRDGVVKTLYENKKDPLLSPLRM